MEEEEGRRCGGVGEVEERRGEGRRGRGRGRSREGWRCWAGGGEVEGEVEEMEEVDEKVEKVEEEKREIGGRREAKSSV